MVDLAVIGCGYVGAVTAACFAHLGHRVTAIDVDSHRVSLLRQGRSPIHEAGLEDLLREGIDAGRLQFLDTYPGALDAGVVFVAVDTPGSAEGAADLRAVRSAVTTVAPLLRPGAVIVNKSTVPIGTGELVANIARRNGHAGIGVVSNPEFLREGSAVHDFFHPDRIILGSDDRRALDRVAALYEPFDTVVQRVDIRTAETIKYASNAFLATKISFINEIAAICEALGADVAEVARGMGMDARIGAQFLDAGLGWGGNCFPKDVRALAHMAALHGTHPQLLRSVMEINSGQRLRAVSKVRAALEMMDGARVLVLGAAFKGGTDDLRNSPAIELARLLGLEGVSVVVYDPVATASQIREQVPEAQVAADPISGARGAHAVVLATDWPEFRDLPFGAMRDAMAGDTFVDARNYLDAETVKRAGFVYRCLGRPVVEGAWPSPDEVALDVAVALEAR